MWLERIAAGLLALLSFLDQERGWARTLILEHEQLALSEAAARVHTGLGEVLDAGRGQVIVGSELTPPTSMIAELLSCAVLSVIRARLLAWDRRPLAELAPSLMEHVLEPYLAAGAGLADRIADPSLPPPAPAEAKILPVRSHPRLLLALHAIAATPGLSTRGVELDLRARQWRGRELSQLLGPLEQRGLIENTRPLASAANAWRLTAYGRRALEIVDGEPRGSLA